MTALDLLASVRDRGGRLEPYGDRLWCPNPAPLQDLLPQIREHRAEILRCLRTEAYERLTASARILGTWLDDLEVPLEERRVRLPEYEQLVHQISELQPYIDRYRENTTRE